MIDKKNGKAKMKKIFLVLCVCLFSSTVLSKSERWFYQPINCFISGTHSTCVTTNYRFKPAFCQAYVEARTFGSEIVSGSFEGWIQVRESETIILSAAENDLIVNINATARCLL